MEVIGRRAYDNEEHRKEQFLDAKDVGPYLDSCRNAWTSAREEAMMNLRFGDDPEQEGWEKLGLMAYPTPANAKYRRAADRKKGRE